MMTYKYKKLLYLISCLFMCTSLLYAVYNGTPFEIQSTHVVQTGVEDRVESVAMQNSATPSIISVSAPAIAQTSAVSSDRVS
jgi:hypothetical protein